MGGDLDFFDGCTTAELTPSMNLQINGEARTFPDPASPDSLTLTNLIESLGMKSDRVAVELNHEIAPHDRWQQIALKDGDRLEIVHFVGGGAI
jgi:thiamine biosynthesis protein ThiS